MKTEINICMKLTLTLPEKKQRAMEREIDKVIKMFCFALWERQI